VFVGPFAEEEFGKVSDVIKVEGEIPTTPDSLREDRVRRYVGDAQSWMKVSWLAREETPGP